MNLKPAPQSALTWLPAALEVMDRNARIPTESLHRLREDRSGLRFTADEDARLLAMLRRGERVRTIAEALGRDPSAIHDRLSRLRRRK